MDMSGQLHATHLHLVPRSKNAWSYTSTPHYALMAWCSVEKAQRQLYLFLAFFFIIIIIIIFFFFFFFFFFFMFLGLQFRFFTADCA
jgi:hypothetical protein